LLLSPTFALEPAWHIYGAPLPAENTTTPIAFDSPGVAQALEFPAAEWLEIPVLGETLRLFSDSWGIGTLLLKYPLPEGRLVLPGRLVCQQCSDAVCELFRTCWPRRSTFEVRFRSTIQETKCGPLRRRRRFDNPRCREARRGRRVIDYWFWNEISIEGTARVRLTDFGLKPPSAAFGAIGARDEMTLHFALPATVRAKLIYPLKLRPNSDASLHRPIWQRT
jgi:hypothetical protein